MWIYWILFLWPALTVSILGSTRVSAADTKRSMWALAIVLTLVIGLRFEVGMDWSNYLEHLDSALDRSFPEVLLGSEPGYYGINWIAAHIGTGIWLVNLVCALAFVSGLFVFCRTLPNPWLALTVAMPYMAIVMAMNYTRQGAAFGFVLWALYALHRGNLRRFVFFIVMAALFHKTAAILMPLGALVSLRNRWWAFAWVGIISLAVYWIFVAESQESLYETYLVEKMASDGAAIRVFMNAVPAALFLFTRNRFKLRPAERQFWTWTSVFILLFIPALVLSPSSTAVDRVGLYLMPIQLIGFSHLSAGDSAIGVRQINLYVVVLAYAIVQYVWFNYSNFYTAWLPYRFYPFEVS